MINLLELYYKYKCEYQNYLIFIKSGSFYELFDNDSLIINSIFYYKVKKIKDTIKTGFPINKIDYVTKLIGNINFVILEDGKIVYKKEFKENKYTTYNFDVNSVIVNSIKIERLTKILNEKLLDSNISNIISDIEMIIGKNI